MGVSFEGESKPSQNRIAQDEFLLTPGFVSEAWRKEEKHINQIYP